MAEAVPGGTFPVFLRPIEQSKKEGHARNFEFLPQTVRHHQPRRGKPRLSWQRCCASGLCPLRQKRRGLAGLPPSKRWGRITLPTSFCAPISWRASRACRCRFGLLYWIPARTCHRFLMRLSIYGISDLALGLYSGFTKQNPMGPGGPPPGFDPQNPGPPDRMGPPPGGMGRPDGMGPPGENPSYR